MKWEDFLINIEKLIDFHTELTNVKYRLAMYEDREFLSSGGILSIQPDFYEMQEGEEKPYLIINQLATFIDYAHDVGSWQDIIAVNDINENGTNGIRFLITRAKSKFSESQNNYDNIYGISSYIREWIEMVLKQKEIIISHRFCYLPVDIQEGEKKFPWIPLKIPVYPLETEIEYFIKYMSTCGTIKVDSELHDKLVKLLS